MQTSLSRDSLSFQFSMNTFVDVGKQDKHTCTADVTLIFKIQINDCASRPPPKAQLNHEEYNNITC